MSMMMMMMVVLLLVQLLTKSSSVFDVYTKVERTYPIFISQHSFPALAAQLNGFPVLLLLSLLSSFIARPSAASRIFHFHFPVLRGVV